MMKIRSLSLCTITFLFVGHMLSCSEGKIQPKHVSSQDSTASLNKPKPSIDLSFLKKKDGAYVIPWDLLMRVTMRDTFDKTLQQDVAMPLWNDTLLSLDKQIVTVDGFYIPVDETGNSEIVVLSAFPFSQCFFCGKAGVESIIDVLPKDKLKSIKTDSKVTFKGKFKLNATDFNYLIYVLQDAELVTK